MGTERLRGALMNFKQFNTIFTAALSASDRATFVSSWRDTETSADCIGEFWDITHMDFKEIAAASGRKLTDFAAEYDIPYRTAQNWKNGARECPPYTRLLLARAVLMERLWSNG